MPADLNRVTLVGRLTRDPELKHSAGGNAIASLRLAVTSRGKDASGAWEDRPNYFDVTVFGARAETACQYLAKGRRIGVDGRLEWREWEDQSGGKRQAVQVIAQDVYFLDGAPQGDRGEQAHAAAQAAPSGWGTSGSPEDDIPF